MADVYGLSKTDPEYDPNCDTNDNGDINIFDIVIATGYYGDNW